MVKSNLERVGQKRVGQAVVVDEIDTDLAQHQQAVVQAVATATEHLLLGRSAEDALAVFGGVILLRTDVSLI